MAIGKWSMYISRRPLLDHRLRLPGRRRGPRGGRVGRRADPRRAPGCSSDSPFRDEAVNADHRLTTIGGVQITAWILAATFLPTAALFVWIGRWFKSMEGGMNSMFGVEPRRWRRTHAAFFPQPGGTVAPGAPVAHTSPMPTEQAPVPKFGDPSLEPPDPPPGASCADPSHTGREAGGYCRPVFLVGSLLARVRLVVGPGHDRRGRSSSSPPPCATTTAWSRRPAVRP